MPSYRAMYHFISRGIEAIDTELNFLLTLHMEERSASQPKQNMQKASSLISIYDIYPTTPRFLSVPIFLETPPIYSSHNYIPQIKLSMLMFPNLWLKGKDRQCLLANENNTYYWSHIKYNN